MEVITAREAFESGLTRYFTGKPCRYGHIAQRMVRNGACVECLRAQRGRYRDRHPDKVQAIQDRHRKTPEYRAKDAANKRRLRAGDPEKERLRLIRWRERLEDRLTQQAGRERPTTCDICEEEASRICFDHSHAKGHFRGWLCDRCNRTLGQVKDDVGLLRKLIAYLEQKEHGEADNESPEGAPGLEICGA